MLNRRGGFDYTCPCYDLCASCKHVIKYAWRYDIIPKPSVLSLEKLTQNKRKGRPKSVGNKCTFDI